MHSVIPLPPDQVRLMTLDEIKAEIDATHQELGADSMYLTDTEKLQGVARLRRLRCMERAVQAFSIALEKEFNNNGLILLAQCGWVEQFPDPNYWWFKHEEHPHVNVYWSHRSGGSRRISAEYVGQ